MINDTITRFAYPQSVIKEYSHWLVLLRPDQATLGSLILAHKGAETNLSDLPEAAFKELAEVTRDIEVALKAAFNYQKINYLTLMMVDKEVHSHVIPRYDSAREFNGLTFTDSGWPALPVLSECVSVDGAQMEQLKTELQAFWPSGQ